MKVCTSCKKVKEIIDFHKGKPKCKACVKSYDRERQRSFEGLPKRMLNNQKHSAKARGHTLPNYTYEELFKWLLANDYTVMYQSWVESNYSRKLTPSCDRQDETKGYTLDNLKLTTAYQNILRHHSERQQGKTGCNSIPVKAYTKQGDYIGRWDSITIACRQLNLPLTGTSNIMYVLDLPKRSAYGYIWKRQ